MVHLLEQIEDRKEKRHRFTLPKMGGRVGLTFELLRKQVFLGIVIADIETETIVRKRKLKVLKQKGTSKFIQL